MSVYELAILGDASVAERQVLTGTIARMVGEFGLAVGTDVIVHDGSTVASRDRRSAFAAAYFGGPKQVDKDVAHEVALSSVPVIPTISQTENFGALVPDFLQASNGLRRRDDDPQLTELSIALLECMGLLRRQRRAFVSYRRVESRMAALQIHDLLSERGFDVFLDTHDVPPGERFQEVLWHRLCDSDVMVMLDTETYFESKWTRQEFGKALAREVHILRVVWPGHAPSKAASLAETIRLDGADLRGADGPITDAKADEIVLAVESLRSRSIASRYMSITGRLRVCAEKVGATVEGIGAHRAISVRLLDDRRVWAYPIVGVPTAELLYDVAEKARRANQLQTPALVYDHIGIRDQWIAHLKWLDDNIRSVRAMKVREADWALTDW